MRTSPGPLEVHETPRGVSDALPIALSSDDANTSMATQYSEDRVHPTRPTSGGGITSPDCEVGDIDGGEDIILAWRRS